MAHKDYYFMLGVSRSESPSGIRKAFRDLARRHHPDHAGPAGTPVFRDVVEAYRVLSDPQQRREYDAQLGSRIPVRTSVVGRSAQGHRRPVLDPLDLFAAPGSIRPASKDLFDRILRNFLWPGTPKSERREPLLCDVALSPREARRGGILPLRIPIHAACRECHGAGHVFGFSCRSCDATGDEQSEMIVSLEVPPDVHSGTIVELPLDPWGIRNLWLRVRIRVAT